MVLAAIAAVVALDAAPAPATVGVDQNRASQGEGLNP